MTIAAALVMGASLTGCMATDNVRDVRQVIATVDITKNSSFNEEFGEYASAVTEKQYVKRDMLISYMNGAHQYASQVGSTGALFDLIKDNLVSDAVVTQYSSVALLKYKVTDESVPAEERLSLDTFKSKQTEKEKYEYLLGGENSEGVKKAKYNLYVMLNNTLDSTERRLIREENGYEGSGTRSTPSGIDTLKEDYIPSDYGVYTGYAGYELADAGKDYEFIKGTDKNKRRQAYSDFVKSLERSYLLTEEDADTTDILELSYTQDTYITMLQSQIVSAYSEVYEKQQEELIQHVEDGVYTYVQDRYSGEEGLLSYQKKQYSSTTSFEAAYGNISDTSFILYSPDTSKDTQEIDGTYGTYGYVYNILLPFSVMQETTLDTLKEYRDNGIIDDEGYFYARNQLLKRIETYDRRDAWFNGETQYAFDAEEYNKEAETKLDYFRGTDESKKADRKYLFFENNVTKNSQYEGLNKYIGLYSYNGKAVENADGSYNLVPNKFGIDGMLKEFAAYIDYVLGVSDGSAVSYDKAPADSFYTNKNFKLTDDKKEIDYSTLVYASGKVTFPDGNLSKEDMFVNGKGNLNDASDRYNVMAAVNELQYAYTTDTGVLSQYIGYSVSAYETSYIKEFEYATQQALRKGVGSFAVCAGDYGWHLIYVTDTFTFNEENGEYNPVFSKERVEKDGTFENRFYNWLKDSALANEVSKKQDEILKTYNTDDAVKVFKDAYKDLSELS